MISCLNDSLCYDMMKYHSSPNMSLTHLVPYIESPECGIWNVSSFQISILVYIAGFHTNED